MEKVQSLPADLSFLFESMVDSLRSLISIPPPSCHLLLLKPSERPAGHESFTRHREAVSACRNGLESLSSRLLDVSSLCSSLDHTLNACSTPVDSLPLELLQHVMRLVIGSPAQNAKIVHLSLVCKRWNSAIFSTSDLFVSPDWRLWPPYYVRKWLSHSGSRLLACNITQRSTSHTIQSLSLLQNRSVSLEIYLTHYELEEFVSLFTVDTMANLKHLTVVGCANEELNLSTAVLPALETLYAPEMRIKGPLASAPALRSLGCIMHCPSDFTAFEAILDHSPMVSHATWFASVSHDMIALSEQTTRSPHPWCRLKSLRFHGYHGIDSDAALSYLQAIEDGNLATLELVDLDKRVLQKVLTELPSSIAFRIETLLIVRGCHWIDLTDSLAFLSTACYQQTVLGTRRNSFPVPDASSIFISSAQPPGNKPSWRWTPSFELMKKVLDARHGILNRLILPPPLKPSDDHNEYSTGREEEQEEDIDARWKKTIPLTTDELSQLQRRGKNLKVEFSWIMDNHGFDIEPPDWT
ncbi:hypothetical protein DL93DRAFT_2232377 [Clavulina sp. PMI_390]|nr:hypothetical protein DL93DRAFT_2232377 [Clavulina sp. PMI_390]